MVISWRRKGDPGSGGGVADVVPVGDAAAAAEEAVGGGGNDDGLGEEGEGGVGKGMVGTVEWGVGKGLTLAGCVTTATAMEEEARDRARVEGMGVDEELVGDTAVLQEEDAAKVEEGLRRLPTAQPQTLRICPRPRLPLLQSPLGSIPMAQGSNWLVVSSPVSPNTASARFSLQGPSRPPPAPCVYPEPSHGSGCTQLLPDSPNTLASDPRLYFEAKRMGSLYGKIDAQDFFNLSGGDGSERSGAGDGGSGRGPSDERNKRKGHI